MSASQPAVDGPAALVLKGFCMGAADVVPGVSGGTMAFILGIYARLIEAIKSFDARWLRAILRLEWREILRRPKLGFLIPLGCGIIAAVAFFTRVVPLPVLINTHPEQVYGLFFGLVSGSIVFLLIESRGVDLREAALLGAGIAVGYLIVTAVPQHTPETWWFVFLCGMIAICAMVLPGISGSFVLLILGKYSYVLDAIGHLKLAIVAPFAAGAAIGIVAFTRVLSWLLRRYYRPTFMLITGFLAASLYVLWPFQQREFVIVRDEARLVSSTPVWPGADAPVLASIVWAVIGIMLVVVLELYSRRVRSQR